MRRRDVVALLGGAAAWPLSAGAQPSGTAARVGFLGNSTPAFESNLVGPFAIGCARSAMMRVAIFRSSIVGLKENMGASPLLVAELLAARVDVIVTAGTPASLAVKNATSTVPLVMVAVGDPVGTGLVPSLARPGSNLTGLSSIAPDLEAKRLELLREIVPKLSHVGLFFNPANPFHKVSLEHAKVAADAMRMRLLVLSVITPQELDGAFAAILASKPGALLVLADRVYLHEPKRMMDFAAEHRLPTANAHKEMVDAGGLLSYGPSYEDMHRRAADYVDTILRGAKPAELPVQQPTRFELVINLATAKALGLTIPPTLLARADEVIE